MRRTAILIPGLICFSMLSWIGPAADAQPSGATVQVIDFEYTPRAVTVAVGGTVNWEWAGSEAHTVSARDGSFESGERNRGAQFPFTFRTAGQFEYFCRVHPNLMTGTVTVQAAPPPSPSPRPTSAAPRPTSAAPSPAPTAARPSPSRTSAPPQTLPAPTSVRPSASSAASSGLASRSPAAVSPVPEVAVPSLSAGTAAPSTSRSSIPLASLDEPRPKDRTGLAIALALLIAAGGIGLGTTLLLRGRLARKLSSPSP